MEKQVRHVGIYHILPKGSQVKLWIQNPLDMSTKRAGDTVPDFGLEKYVVLLREGGYVIVKNGIITKIVENYGRKYYHPDHFPGIDCFDKWGNHVFDSAHLKGTGLMDEDYYNNS